VRLRRYVCGVVVVGILACCGGLWLLKKLVSPGLGVSRRVLDLGQVERGVPAEGSIRIANPTKEYLNIKGVMTSCNCISAVSERMTIGPGQSTLIAVRLDTTGYAGIVRKHCTVLFEEARASPIDIEATAFVYEPELDLSSARIDLGDVVVGRGASVTIKVLSDRLESGGWEVEGVECSPSGVHARYQRDTRIILCILDPDQPVGVIKGEIVVGCRGVRGRASKTIPLVGRVVGPVRAWPPRVFVGTVTPGSAHRIAVGLYGERSALKAVVKSNAECGLRTVRWARNGELMLTDKVRAPLEGGPWSGVLRVGTGSETQPELQIPYYGYVREE